MKPEEREAGSTKNEERSTTDDQRSTIDDHFLPGMIAPAGTAATAGSRIRIDNDYDNDYDGRLRLTKNEERNTTHD